MDIKTKFSNGDVVYSVQRSYITDNWHVIGPMTVGQVRVEITDSPGLDGEDTFDNYMAQSSRKEQYMCVETGVGSGALYDSIIIFSSRNDAQSLADSKNKEEQQCAK